MSVAAVVLAAGEASRYGAPKQRLLLPEVLRSLATAPVDEVVVVAGAHPLELPHAMEARLVPCAGWEHGPGASLRCGLDTLADEVALAVVVLADGPDLAPEAIARVLAVQRESGADVVAASYGGERGHPLVLARPAWDGVPDEGLRFREVLLVPCDDLGAPGDVDTPADLPERLR